jgi:lysozyme
MADMLYESIKRHEGFSLRPYQCTAGATTIGWGRNLDAIGVSVDIAEQMLAEDIERAIRDAISWIGLPGAIERLSEARQAVIIEMAFNLGLPRLMTFKKFKAAVIIEDWNWAADEMLSSRWADQVKSRAVRLAEQMRSGVFWMQQK